MKHECKHSVHATANIRQTLQVLQLNHKYYQQSRDGKNELLTSNAQQKMEKRNRDSKSICLMGEGSPKEYFIRQTV